MLTVPESGLPENAVQQFKQQVKSSQLLWALQDKISGDWVIVDSANFENTDLMPLWSSESLANQHCYEEWQDFSAVAISVSEWLEFWVEELSGDNIMIGLNWQEQDEYPELDLAEFSQIMADLEVFRKDH